MKNVFGVVCFQILTADEYLSFFCRQKGRTYTYNNKRYFFHDVPIFFFTNYGCKSTAKRVGVQCDISVKKMDYNCIYYKETPDLGVSS
jgi:hypothetical protein